MKKLTWLLTLILIISSTIQAYAANAIYKTTDGTQLKCTATKKSGSIKEYGNKITDYYTFKNGQIYSRNLIKLFSQRDHKKKQDEAKVGKMRAPEGKIAFREAYSTETSTVFKWSTIDKKTGEYYFKSKKMYGWGKSLRSFEAEGSCTVIIK